jgi:hypothetical protein
MEHDPHQHLIRLCKALSTHVGRSHWRVSFLITGNGQFFQRLEAGKTCTFKTAHRVMQAFSDQWPQDLEWPSDIPRPDQLCQSDHERGAA